MEENSNQNKTKQDHLNDFIKSQEQNDIISKPPIINTESEIQYFGQNVRKKVDTIEVDNWINIPLKTLPYNKFYQINTQIYIKPLTTKEKQAFAVVDENNPLDVSNKLNQVFKTCVKVLLPDGSRGSYRDIMDGDKQTLALALAKLSAKNGRKFEHKVKNSNGEEVAIEMIPANYVYPKEHEDIKEFFNEETRVYEFKNPSNNDVIKLAPPTIGLTEDLHVYLYKKSIESKGQDIPSVSFIQNILYMQSGKGVRNITTEQFQQIEFEFEKINGDRFEVIVDVVENYLDFGIKKIKTQSSTGEMVEADFRYPGGARNLFIVPNAFKKFIGQ